MNFPNAIITVLVKIQCEEVVQKAILAELSVVAVKHYKCIFDFPRRSKIGNTVSGKT